MAFWSDPSSLFPKQSHRWVVFLEPFSDQNRINIPHYLVKSADKPSYKIDTVQAKYLYSHTFNFPKRLVWNPIKIEFYDVFWTVQTKAKLPYSNRPLDLKDTYGKTYNTDAFSEDGGATITQKSSQIEESSAGRAPVDIAGSSTIDAKSTQRFFYNFLRLSGYYDPNEGIRGDKNLTISRSEEQLSRFRSYHFKKNMIMALSGQVMRESELLIKKSNDYQHDFINLAELDENGNTIDIWKIYNPLITDVTSTRLDYSSDTVSTITVGITYDWAELTDDTREIEIPSIRTE